MQGLVIVSSGIRHMQWVRAGAVSVALDARQWQLESARAAADTTVGDGQFELPVLVRRRRSHRSS